MKSIGPAGSKVTKTPHHCAISTHSELCDFLGKGTSGTFQEIKEHFLLNIFVLLQKTLHCVSDWPSVVGNPELHSPETLVRSLHKVLMGTKLMMELLQEGLVCGLERVGVTMSTAY